jgi:hypothetical protein
MATLPYVIALLAILLAMNNTLPRFRDGYRCIQCGTKRQDRHSEGCSWKG